MNKTTKKCYKMRFKFFKSLIPTHGFVCFFCLLVCLSQVAVEHKSAEVTRLLLDEGASAGVKDDNGMSALSLLISQMPVVVS